MNIFVLDEDPRRAVSYLCDRHLTVMPKETAQLLCSPFREGDSPYKTSKAMYNHPCAKWARDSADNYEWLVKYGFAICSEFHYRRGKPHACAEIVLWAFMSWYRLNLPRVGQTPFAQVMPDECRVNYVTDSGIIPSQESLPKEVQTNFAVQAYRNLYAFKFREWFTKGNTMSWGIRERPEWLKHLL